MRKDKKIKEFMRGWNASLDELDELLDEILSDSTTTRSQMKIVSEIQQSLHGHKDYWGLIKVADNG